MEKDHHIGMPFMFDPISARDTLVALSDRVKQAEQVRSDEIAGQTLLAKVVDWVGTTAPEDDLAQAKLSLAAHTGFVREQLPGYITERTLILLQDDPALAQQVAALDERANRMRPRAESLASAARLGTQAISDLETAKSECSHASTMELFDGATSNVGLSLLSSMSTSTAASAVTTANKSVTRFAERVKTVQQSALDVPEAWADFAVDMITDFDVFSFYNAFKLAETEEACAKMITTIKPIVARVGGVSQTAQDQLSLIASEKATLLAPVRENVLDGLPQELRALDPDRYMQRDFSNTLEKRRASGASKTAEPSRFGMRS